eukprot:1378438-Rhodomonas_salina.1
MTGEIAYFEWPCRGAEKHRSGTGHERQFPPECPQQHAGVGHVRDVCFGDGHDCALCIEDEGYCKPTGGSISVSKINGIGGLKGYYFLNVMGEPGHPLKVSLPAALARVSSAAAAAVCVCVCCCCCCCCCVMRYRTWAVATTSFLS